jgi:hypothetical protein
LEDENRRLKRLVADQALDNQILKTLTHKVVTPTARRDAIDYIFQRYGISQRRGGGLMNIRLSSKHYQAAAAR